MAPKGTPVPILNKLRTTIAEILKEKDTIEKMQLLGLEPGDADAQALSRRIVADINRWSSVAKAANIKPE
jgi:tripartite-type tricarboxylate transporter receptor subunit TctC